MLQLSITKRYKHAETNSKIDQNFAYRSCVEFIEAVASKDPVPEEEV